MKKLIVLFSISCLACACEYNWPITAGYFIPGEPLMPQADNSKFGYLLYSKLNTEFIAGYVKHVYYNDNILIAQQDSLSYPTWYVIQPKKFEHLAGAWDDDIIGPITTEQRDSILRRLNLRLKDLKHNDYTSWRYPKE